MESAIAVLEKLAKESDTSYEALLKGLNTLTQHELYLLDSVLSLQKLAQSDKFKD